MSLPAEFTVVVFGILLALVAPLSLSRTRASAGRLFRAIGRSNGLTLLAAFSLPLVILPGLTLRSGIPHPYVHDEFVYLLMGETFARGELTNPTPAHAEHFRSPHLILEPSYQGKYPPAQGLFLAAGALLTGLPIAGVWLSFACASTALCWMLRAWMPNRWALLGSVLFSFHPMISIAWGETYWGGAVAVLGGSLLFGAIGRLEREPSWRLGVFLGLGLVILANSRPYEGLMASLPAAGWFAWLCWSWIRRQRVTAVCSLVAATVAVLITGFLLTTIYNHAVTGDPFKMPYQVWVEQALESSSIGDLLLDENASRPTTFTTAPGQRTQSLTELPRWQFKLLRHHVFFLRTPLIVPLLAIPWLLRKPRVLIAVATYCLVYACVMSNQHSGWPHYYAPATPLLFYLCIHGIRHLSASGWRLRCLATVCTFGLTASGVLAQIEWSGSPYASTKLWVYAHNQIVRSLSSTGMQHIVFVRYSISHDKSNEWVWNTGRPEKQNVIWAHSLGEISDYNVRRAFPQRLAWCLDVGSSHCRLSRCNPSSAARQQTYDFTSMKPALSEVGHSAFSRGFALTGATVPGRFTVVDSRVQGEPRTLRSRRKYTP